VRLKIGIKERLVSGLGAITAVVTWFAAIEAASRLPGGHRSIEGRWWARIFDPGTHDIHWMAGSQSKLSDAVKGRPLGNRRTDGVGLNLFGGFNVGKHLVEGWHRGGLEQVEQIFGEVVCDAVAILVGRRFEQSHCSVDKTNHVVNVSTLQMLRIENYESISCVTLSIYSATTDGRQTAMSHSPLLRPSGARP